MPGAARCLLALALLGCAGLSFCSRLPAEDTDAALDTAFLQSWLHLDSGLAAKLASEGAAAAAARRKLMAASASAGTFGAQELAGAYPTPCVANCKTCGPTGACAICKGGFTTQANGQCKRKRTCYQPALCNACPADKMVCTSCKAFVPNTNPRISIYTVKGVCKKCTAPNCGNCNLNGTCKNCRAYHKKDNKGNCVCALKNCAKCPGGRCQKCKVRYTLVDGRCQWCRVKGCVVCKRGKVNQCAACAKYYNLVKGRCVRK